jgi:NAD(P)-dependent dehydrogenase (short-subunit alcohol dehydrogenase family)
MELRGKTILVTGAAKRVGREIALALARRGAHIALHYNTSKVEAEKTAGEISALGVRVELFQAELGSDTAIAAMVSAVLEKFGRLDGLVNNAAVFFKTPLDTLTAEDWDRTMSVNLRAVFLCSVHAGRAMLEGGGGAIVSIADWAGERPYRDYVPYCVSKAGVIALTKGLAKTFAPKVRVNCIGPGPVLTPADLSSGEAAEIMEKTPMKRHGSPMDVAAAVVFLFEGSDFITGAFLPVDGGRLIA